MKTLLTLKLSVKFPFQALYKAIRLTQSPLLIILCGNNEQGLFIKLNVEKKQE
jgi:hypothetical protein